MIGPVRRHAAALAPVTRRSLLAGLGGAAAGGAGLIALAGRRPAPLEMPTGAGGPAPRSRPAPEPGAPGRLSEMSHRVLALARKEAAFFQHDQIRTEHILLAIAAVPEAVASRLLRRQGVDPQAVVRAMVARMHIGRAVDSRGITLSGAARRAIEVAGLEARRLGAEFVGTEHLLLGILAERESLAWHCATLLGADPAGLRRAAAGIHTG